MSVFVWDYGNKATGWQLLDGVTPFLAFHQGEGGVAPPVVEPTAATGGGRWRRYYTPVTEEPKRKRKRKEPEVVVKEDVVIETVYVDWAGVVGSVEQVQAAMAEEDKRLEQRRKRARNKALILLMLSQ